MTEPLLSCRQKSRRSSARRNVSSGNDQVPNSLGLAGLPSLHNVLEDLEDVFRAEANQGKFPSQEEARATRNLHVSNALTAFTMIFKSHLKGVTWFDRFKRFRHAFIHKTGLVKCILASQDFRDMAIGTNSLDQIVQRQVTYNYYATGEDLDLEDFKQESLSAVTREYILQVLVIMMLLSFNPHLNDNNVEVQPKNKGRSLSADEEPVNIISMLRRPMPQMPEGRWRESKQWTQYCTDFSGDLSVLPLHPSWCQEGSPLVRVGSTYVWSMGLMHAHWDFEKAEERLNYRELISTETIVMSAFRSFISDFHGEMTVRHDSVNQAQMKIVGAVAALFVAGGSWFWNTFVAAALEHEMNITVPRA